MSIGQDTIDHAIQFLIEGQEVDAANVLRACQFAGCEVVDGWMDGNRPLDGISIQLTGPRSVYEVLVHHGNPITQSIQRAIRAVLPSDMYLKTIDVRAVSHRSIAQHSAAKISEQQRKDLIGLIDLQKSTMIAVATGGPRIQEKDTEYQQRRAKIKGELARLGMPDPNPYADLWAWYGKWSDGSLPTYQSRRRYISELYQTTFDALQIIQTSDTVTPVEPTGWTRVDRGVDAIRERLETAKTEEEFQTVGLLCRETIISLAQAVYDPLVHPSNDGIKPSSTDANRMLEAFIGAVLPGGTNETTRKHAKSVLALAVELQHKRTAQFRDAALCAEATHSVVNLIAIISGRRDP